MILGLAYKGVMNLLKFVKLASFILSCMFFASGAMLILVPKSDILTYEVDPPTPPLFSSLTRRRLLGLMSQ